MASPSGPGVPSHEPQHPPRVPLPHPGICCISRGQTRVSCFGNQSGLFATEDHTEFSLLTNARFPLTWQLSPGQNLLNLIEPGGVGSFGGWGWGREVYKLTQIWKREEDRQHCVQARHADQGQRGQGSHAEPKLPGSPQGKQIRPHPSWGAGRPGKGLS